MGQVVGGDQTMPALFAAPVDEAFTPVAQLGAGPDGVVVLGQRGARLVELHQLTIAAGSPRWLELERRARLTISASFSM